MTDEQAQVSQTGQPTPAPGWTVGADGTWVPSGWAVRPVPGEPATASAPDSVAASDTAPPGLYASALTASDLEGSASLANGPGDRHRRRGRRIVAAGVTAALVIAGLTVGIGLGTGGGRSASAAVVDAVDSTLADRTAQLSLSATVAAGTKALKETGSGSVDFSQNTGQFTMTVTIDGRVIPAQIRLLGGVEYLRAPTVGQREPGKSWISTQVSPTKSNLDTLASPGGTPTNVAATLRLFGQSDNAVTSIGPSTIDGVPVEGYSVRPGPATIEAEMAKAADLPSRTRAVVAQFVNGLSAKVSIDDQGLVRSVDMTMAVSTGPTTETMRFTLGLSDYGTTKVDVTAPTPAQVVTVGPLAHTWWSTTSGSPADGPTAAT